MKIDLTEPTTLFNEFINDENNSRILFSAKFGMGKTYFLKEFFKNKNDYETFHLFPINYQVCQNEDIFEIIKFDILLKLMEKDWIIQDEKINHNLAMQSFLINGGTDFLSPIIKMIPKTHIVVDSFENITNFFNNYQQYIKKLNNATFDLLNNFGSDITNQKGSIYEQDSITNIIIESISNHKNNKKTVLIVDDLDRIDPEHVFRILNIFSAHFDLDTENENKFGFDKIIIVCDIDNIKKIFHAKYGESTDFEGYIDKFYSKSCFIYSNQKAVLNYLRKIFQFNIDKTDLNNSIYINEILENYVYPIINDFIKYNFLNLRDLLKINKTNFVLRNFSFIYSNKNQPIPRRYFKIIIVFQCLELIFGNNKNKIIRALTVCSKNANFNKNINNMINQIVLLAFPIEKINLNGLSVFTENTLKLGVRFTKISEGINSTYYTSEKLTFVDLDTNATKEEIRTNEIYYLLLKAYENYLNIVKIYD